MVVIASLLLEGFGVSICDSELLETSLEAFVSGSGTDASELLESLSHAAQKKDAMHSASLRLHFRIDMIVLLFCSL